MSAIMYRPGEKVAFPGTFIERGPRGGEVPNPRIVTIESGDSPLPPTQKPSNKWIHIYHKTVANKYLLETNKVKLYETFMKRSDNGEIKTYFHMKVELYEFIKNHFNKGEIKTLCFYLDVEYDLLEGKGKADKARELVLFFERHGRLAELKNEVTRQRPFISWLN